MPAPTTHFNRNLLALISDRVFIFVEFIVLVFSVIKVGTHARRGHVPDTSTLVQTVKGTDRWE